MARAEMARTCEPAKERTNAKATRQGISMKVTPSQYGAPEATAHAPRSAGAGEVLGNPAQRLREIRRHREMRHWSWLGVRRPAGAAAAAAGGGTKLSTDDKADMEGTGRRGGRGCPDWACPACSAHVFGSRTSCYKCGTTRPQHSAPARAGDWTCPACHAHVFGHKAACFRCGVGRPALARGAPSRSRGPALAPPAFSPAITMPSPAREDELLTVGTFNVLHPPHALHYGEPEGLDAQTGQSNWAARAPRIGGLLREHALDAYLLQELGPSELEDLRPLVENAYEVVYARHPLREGGDGVCVLLRKGRLELERAEAVPLKCRWPEPDGGEPYMCVAVAVARDLRNGGARLLLACAHLYSKKTHRPEETLLDWLDARAPEVSCVVWGGDCNRGYARGERAPYACAPPVRPTRRASGKTIDWIFARAGGRAPHPPAENDNGGEADRRGGTSPRWGPAGEAGSCAPVRTARTEAFVEATWRATPLLSDHYAEAVAVPVPLRAHRRPRPHQPASIIQGDP